MKIVIDVRCLGEGRRTGVEEYITRLFRSLVSGDTKNEYILFFNAWNRDFPEDFKWMFAYPNVRLVSLRIPNKILNLALWYLGWPKLDRLCGGADIYFLPNLNFVSVSKRAKLVVTAHDLSFEAFPETFSVKRRLWHFFIGFRKLCRKADRILAVSASTKEDVIGYYGIPEEKITVVRSGVGEEFHQLDRNNPELLRVKEKYDLPYRFILFFGTFESRKNIRSVIRAYNAYREMRKGSPEYAKLVLAGSPGWKSNEIFRERESSPYRDDILVLGFAADEEKVFLYNLASLFVYPSFYEGFGFPPLEAMACGVPTIVSRNSSFPEIVGDAAILIDPYQPDELRLAMTAILSDRVLSEQLSSDGRNRTREFSWKKTGRETLRVIRGF